MNEDINYAISYPELSPEGQEKTQQIIDKFTKQMQDLVNNTLFDFTSNIGAEIVNDDSWINVRQLTLEAFCGYSESERRNKAADKYLGQWWKQIRAKIFEENRESIISDIIADKDLEIKTLNERIEYMQKYH
jgi:hypothetical protein